MSIIQIDCYLFVIDNRKKSARESDASKNAGIEISFGLRARD